MYGEHPEELYRVQPEEMYSAHEHPEEVCLGYDQQVGQNRHSRVKRDVVPFMDDKGMVPIIIMNLCRFL